MERRGMNRKEIGEAGESLACEVLCRQGYRILCRNYRCPYGEIDIIAGKGGKLIFAEVKTRLSDGFGAGRDSVGSTKRSRIRRAAGYFFMHSKGHYDSVDFQVIEIHVAQICENEF